MNRTETISETLASNHLDTDNISWLERTENITAADVRRQLNCSAGAFSLDRLAVLLSPVAAEFLEQMAQQAKTLTTQRFGKTITLYAPLYVSNFCINNCSYCGCSTQSKQNRIRLDIDQAIAEAEILAEQNIRHILIVSGEDPAFITPDYLCRLAEKLKNKFSSISIEVYPMSRADYEKLFAAGIDGITIYQETYNRDDYKKYHRTGPKADFDFRLHSPDRAAAAGFRRIGIGALLGLSNWRIQTLALAGHADYLIKKYWRSQISFSFPRLRPAENVNTDIYKNLIADAQLAQMMIALRLCFADAGIVLSTRESPLFRDNMANICATRLSAGSKTSPGGYSQKQSALKQFEIHDNRCVAEVAEAIKSIGKEPVFKDWDKTFNI